MFTLHLLTCFIFLHTLTVTSYISFIYFFLSVPQLLLQSEYKLPKSIVLIYFIHYSIPIVQNTV